ncbi:hypothetical protein LPJ63_001503 [Coemansia sp. RSA 2711]|nr:hypothetical protein LPJ63_001503 [Coemansia sp. RSA 2711]KAJ2304151.1 hypothetical protein IWW54_005500 [Coemansia sp. RSA 2705]
MQWRVVGALALRQRPLAGLTRSHQLFRDSTQRLAIATLRMQPPALEPRSIRLLSTATRPRRGHGHSGSRRRFGSSAHSERQRTDGGRFSTAVLVPISVIGGVVAAVYTKRTVHCEAAVAMGPPEASVRLRILHEQAAKTARSMGAAKARVQRAARGGQRQSLAAHLVRLLAPEWWLFVGVALTAVGAAAVSLWTPVVTGDLINVIARSVRAAAAMDASVVAALRAPARRLLALFVANGLLTFAHTTLVTVLGERVGARLHAQALDALLWHDLAFFDSAQSGALAARVRGDVGEFQTTFKRLVTQGLKSATLAAGVAWQLVRLSPALTLTLAATMPPAYAALALYGRVLRRLRRTAHEWDALASGVAAEAVANVRTVRALGAEGAELQLFREARGEQAASSNRFGLHMGAFRGLTATTIGCMVLTVLYSGGRLVARGAMTPGDLMAFMLATQSAQRALDALGALLGQTVRARSAIARVLEIVDLQPTIARSAGVRPAQVRGHVRFMDVDFSYPTRPDAPVLRRFNLDVAAGEVVALCGASGAGKSTVAALLERFYDPSGGEIWLDAYPLTHLDASWLRRQIGFIPQEPALFSTTIRENLRLAQPTATNAEIEQACRLANAHEFIRQFPGGYDTVVGERGALLSGGQKQRLSIARAILRDPRILVLDEATSSLDAESERAVQQALDRLMVGRTVLVIAHRLSTIRSADRIVVMGRVPGHIVEQGTHEQLLAQKGAYYRLHQTAG